MNSFSFPLPPFTSRLGTASPSRCPYWGMGIHLLTECHIPSNGNVCYISPATGMYVTFPQQRECMLHFPSNGNVCYISPAMGMCWVWA